MILCICNNVSEKQLLDDVQNNRKLSSGNHCCKHYILEFLQNVETIDVSKYLEDLNREKY